MVSENQSPTMQHLTLFKNDSYMNLMAWTLEAGAVPSSIADVMLKRLELINSNLIPIEGSILHQYGFETGDAAAFYRENVKIVYDAQQLRGMIQDDQLSQGGLILTREQYEKLDGPEFSREDIEKAGLTRPLRISEVKTHPIWQALARDNHLLSEYADAVFAKQRSDYGRRNDKAMPVRIIDQPYRPLMFPWEIGGFNGYGVETDNDIASRFNTIMDSFDYYKVGIYMAGKLPGETSVPSSASYGDIQKARDELGLLKGIVKPEMVKSLDVLLTSLMTEATEAALPTVTGVHTSLYSSELLYNNLFDALGRRDGTTVEIDTQELRRIVEESGFSESELANQFGYQIANFKRLTTGNKQQKIRLTGHNNRKLLLWLAERGQNPLNLPVKETIQ
ncbi:MAG: hypothetical protein IH934_07820 [Nanoarchaeota archaeon]|nr:hypothetical protein [Nanoarchaeota archaeon]